MATLCWTKFTLWTGPCSKKLQNNDYIDNNSDVTQDTIYFMWPAYFCDVVANSD